MLALFKPKSGRPPPCTPDIWQRSWKGTVIFRLARIQLLTSEHNGLLIFYTQFAYYSSLGLLSPSLTYLDHPDNLIILCGVCHPSYDSDHPYWVMVPDSATLSRYIQHERADYNSRARAARRGIYQDRTLPVVDRTLIRYHPCILDPLMVPGLSATVRIAEWPKMWLGDPIAALIKAAAGLCQPSKRFTATHATMENITLGVPPTLKRKSCQLLDLWCRKDPDVKALLPPSPPGGRPSSGGSNRAWRHRHNCSSGRRKFHREQGNRVRQEQHEIRENRPMYDQSLHLPPFLPETQTGEDQGWEDATLLD